jgi:hypothetical protein
MSTIAEAIKQVQEAVAIAIPGMDVTVNISLAPKLNGKPIVKDVVKAEPIKVDVINAEPVNVDLDHIRKVLNSFAKTAGPDKAISLVKRFTSDGSKDAKQIPEDQYMNVLAAMEDENGQVVLETQGEDG